MTDQQMPLLDPVEAAGRTQRRRKVKEDTPAEIERKALAKALLATYETLLGDMARDVNWGRTAKAAKVLSERGYTPDQVATVYAYMKRQPFWADKMLHLDRLVENMTATLARTALQAGAGQTLEGRFDYRLRPDAPVVATAPPLTPEGKVVAPNAAEVEAARKRLEATLGFKVE